MSDRERRIFTVSDSEGDSKIELRNDADDGGTGTTDRISGFAPKWNRWSRVMVGVDAGFKERFARDAFTNLDDDIIVTVEHQASMLLGRTSAGTARVESRSAGLFYEVDLPNTTPARDLAQLVKRGDISGSSFEFVADEDEWREKKSGTIERTITKARLFQVGPVATPAYDGSASSVSMRSVEKFEKLVEAHRSEEDEESSERIRREAERVRRLRISKALY